MKKQVKKKVVKKTAKKKVTKKVTKKKVAKKNPVDMMISRVEKEIKQLEKENAPADKIMKKLEKFCEKNQIKIFGTFVLESVEKNTTRFVNCTNGIERAGLIKITEDNL